MATPRVCVIGAGPSGITAAKNLLQVGITPIVYDQPWNRGNHGFTVVKNWQEISSLISWNG